MARKRWQELRPESDRRRRKSPHDGLKYLESLLLLPEDEDADKPGKRKKGRKETASRLTATDA